MPKISILNLSILLAIATIAITQPRNERYSSLQIPQKIKVRLVDFVNLDNDFTLAISYSINTSFSGDAVFCFRKRIINTNVELGTCELSDEETNITKETSLSYTCFRIFKNNEGKWEGREYAGVLKYSQQRQNRHLVSFESLIQTGAYEIDVTQSQKSLNVSTFFKPDQVYEMKTCSNFIQSTNKCGEMRMNFVHTYLHQNLVDNLIMQRHQYCFLETSNDQNKHILIFTGGVQRDNQQYYFFGILVIKATADLNMWGGISYSFMHTLSDMFGFQTRTGAAYDLFSLYASGPFLDIATNINGTNNIVVTANSFDQKNIKIKSFYVQYYRHYNTGDGVSDDTLVQKIYNPHCFAAYFDDFSVDSVVSPLTRNLKHTIVPCWTPILSIHADHLKIFQWTVLMISLAMLI